MLRAERAVLFSLMVSVSSALFCVPARAQQSGGSAQAGTGKEDSELLKKIEVDPEKERAARGLFDAGNLAFNEGRFEDALAYFKQAYDLAPKPKLLFNIGTVLDRLRRDREALATFQEYLVRVPQADNRAAVEARSKLLKEAIDKEDALATQAAQAEQQKTTEAANAQSQQDQNAQAAPPPDAAPAPSDSADESPNLVPLIIVGAATVVAGGITLWSHLDTGSALDTYENDPTKTHYEDGVSKQTRTTVLMITTGVLAAATGVVAYFTFASSGESDTAQASVTPWVDADGGGAVAHLRF